MWTADSAATQLTGKACGNPASSRRGGARNEPEAHNNIINNNRRVPRESIHSQIAAAGPKNEGAGAQAYAGGFYRSVSTNAGASVQARRRVQAGDTVDSREEWRKGRFATLFGTSVERWATPASPARLHPAPGRPSAGPRQPTVN